MRGLAYGVLTATISGIFVAALSYFLLTHRESRAHVDVRFNVVKVPSDLSDKSFAEIDIFFRDFLSQNFPDYDPKEYNYRLIGSFQGLRDRLPIGRLGLIEQLEVKNSEYSKSAKIRVEGRDVDFAIVKSRSQGVTPYTSNFTQDLDLVPGEVAKILHFSRHGSYSSFLGSQNLYLSQGGKYFDTSNQPNFFDGVVGDWLSRYPFLGFIFFVSSSTALIATIATAVTASRWKWRVATARNFMSNNDFAVHSYLMKEMRKNSSDRIEAIENLVAALEDNADVN